MVMYASGLLAFGDDLLKRVDHLAPYVAAAAATVVDSLKDNGIFDPGWLVDHVALVAGQDVRSETA